MITKVIERSIENLPKPVINFLKSQKVFKRSLTEMDTAAGDDFGDEDTLTIYKADPNQLEEWDTFQAKEGCTASHLPPTPIDPNGRRVLIAFGDRRRYTQDHLYIPDEAQRMDAILVYVVLDESVYREFKKRISNHRKERQRQQQKQNDQDRQQRRFRLHQMLHRRRL